ncbi:hypothetical protein AAVH_24055 [Aphelenchoides avenae]|nr:hypothetical protein AAVH_24055 [Aphelenchus avenae]
MWTRRRGELLPDQSEYTVDVDDETTRYTSEKSGIVVEVEESRLVIQSTAKLAQEKPRTSNDVSPVVPLVQ